MSVIHRWQRAMNDASYNPRAAVLSGPCSPQQPSALLPPSCRPCLQVVSRDDERRMRVCLCKMRGRKGRECIVGVQFVQMRCLAMQLSICLSLVGVPAAQHSTSVMGEHRPHDAPITCHPMCLQFIKQTRLPSATLDTVPAVYISL